MAIAITSLGSTFDTNAGSKTVTAVPAAGSMIVVLCFSSARTTVQAPTVSDDNSSGAYSQHPTAATKNGSGDSLWGFFRTATVAAGVSTVFTMTQAGDSGGGLEVFQIVGATVTGLSLVRSSGHADNIVNTVAATPSFDNAPLSTNAVIGMECNSTNPAGITQPTSWTKSTDTGYNTPVNGIATAFRTSGETLQTITWPSTANNKGVLMFELDAGAAAQASDNVPHIIYGRGAC